MTIDGKDTVAIPVTTKHHDQRKLLDLVREKISPRTRNLLELREMELPAAKKLLVRTPQKLLSAALTALFEEKGVAQRDELRHEIPDCWEKHGDLVLLPDTAFSSDDWKDFGRCPVSRNPTLLFGPAQCFFGITELFSSPEPKAYKVSL